MGQGHDASMQTRSVSMLCVCSVSVFPNQKNVVPRAADSASLLTRERRLGWKVKPCPIGVPTALLAGVLPATVCHGRRNVALGIPAWIFSSGHRACEGEC